MRIDGKIKERARKAFKAMGLDLSSGTRLLISKVASGDLLASADELYTFIGQGGKDVLKALGPISDKEYEYYENL